MKELARSTVVGFLAGVCGALLVLWFSATDERPEQQVSQYSDEYSELPSRMAALEKRVTGMSAPPVATAKPNPGIEPAMTERAAATRAASLVSDRSQDDYMADYLKKSQERTHDQLRNAGWSDAEIRSLDEAKIAASLEIEQRMYEQMRRSFEENPSAMDWWGQQHTIRDSLGQEKYEQYLVAVGKPTSMTIKTVLHGSAGDAAGLRQGDQIRRYGSDRVYDEQDLMMSVMKGEPGESVTIELERDGAIFHITVPRGPLGTSQIARMMIAN